MAHFCRICHRYRPNEKFSGGGHRIHVCRNCQKRPASERARIENTDEIHGFLTQSHISEKNLGRLRALAASSDESVAGMARVVLEIGKVHPYKRNRFKFLLWKRRDLLNQLSEVGFGDIYMWFPDEVSSNEADSDETYSDEEYEALERDRFEMELFEGWC
jgi:hypothetical protein